MEISASAVGDMLISHIDAITLGAFMLIALALRSWAQYNSPALGGLIFVLAPVLNGLLYAALSSGGAALLTPQMNGSNFDLIGNGPHAFVKMSAIRSSGSDLNGCGPTWNPATNRFERIGSLCDLSVKRFVRGQAIVVSNIESGLKAWKDKTEEEKVFYIKERL